MDGAVTPPADKSDISDNILPFPKPSQPSPANPGASPSDWVHLDLVHGLGADLLPVVSDPAAELGAHSQHLTGKLGKIPTRFNHEGKVVGFAKWTTHQTTAAEIAIWSREPRYGIGIQCRSVRAIDIDVDDPVKARVIAAAFCAAAGIESAPVRSRSNSGKCLLVVRVDPELDEEGDPIKIAKFSFDVDGGKAEFLCDGQQFIGVGLHPSGVRYEWEGGLPHVIPVLTKERYITARKAVAAQFALADATERSASVVKGADLDIDDPVAEWLSDNWPNEGFDQTGKKLFIDCPWEDQHSSAATRGAAVWLVAGSNGIERGHFNCFHDHCRGRTEGDFFQATGYATQGFESYPALVPQNSDLGDTAPALARPWRYCDPRTIPEREWLYGKHYIRKFVSTTFAPGGLGKSALALVEAMAIASGRPLLGVEPRERVRVWYFNGEDPLEETVRRIAAACIHYGLGASDLEGWLYLGSGRDTDLVIATQGREGVQIALPVVREVTDLITKNEIGLAIIDPFVSTHAVSENDNGAINTVAKTWGRIADRGNCAIELVHHVRKTQPGVATTVEDGRGASALLSAGRAARVLNVMTEEEASKAGIDNNRAYFRANDGKANLAPAEHGSDWYRFRSVHLGNGATFGEEGDSVGVVTAWSWPDRPAFADADVIAVQAVLAHDHDWRASDRANRWIGHLVARTMGLEMPSAKRRAVDIVRQWETAGYIKREWGKDASRKDREFFTVGAATVEITAAE